MIVSAIESEQPDGTRNRSALLPQSSATRTPRNNQKICVCEV